MQAIRYLVGLFSSIIAISKILSSHRLVFMSNRGV